MESEQHNKEVLVWNSVSSFARRYPIPVAIIFAGFMIAASNYLAQARGASATTVASQNAPVAQLEEKVTPPKGIELKVRWGDLGKKMVAAGVIDEKQFNALYAERGGMSDDTKALLDSANNGNLVITPQNASTILNLLWAFGLGNKNPILETGPMQNPQYGGAGKFASTGGWTLAVGDAMSHYSTHQFITLTPQQQALVESVAKNIYRPCCGNSTYFPDCNHGMAMLGLLELMASQGATESQMYQAALAVNSYWFPDTYLTIAQYFANKGVDWSAVDPKIVLGASYSSAQGYQTIQSQTQPVQGKSSGGCSV